MVQRQYITTAIDYPNAAPHMGHVLEKIVADVSARWFRLQGQEVRFQIGTDEHGIKIQRTAEKEKIDPQALVDRNVELFVELYDKLQISYDEFIRTSDQKVHWPTVVALWKKLQQTGVLEKRSYTGLYCSGCERFMTARDLDSEGKCPNHQVEPEKVTEENWFLKMSEYTEDLKSLLTDTWDGESYRITPSFRENETLSLLDQGLEDVSFSRPTSSLSWGVPVPDDEGQTMYVWCDALTNYISGIGLLTDSAEAKWWDEANVTHVIGKDIARFHALIWPLMLKKAGIRTPDTLLIHGFLTSEGEKMSKSLGNVVVPDDVLAKFLGNPDPIRFYLTHEVPVGRDGDFSWDRFESLYDSKLRKQLGNLLNRVLVMLKKQGGDLQEFSGIDSPLDEGCISDVWNVYTHAMNTFSFSDALGLDGAFKFIDFYNKQMDVQKPWEKDEEEKTRILTIIAEGLRHASLMLLPFMPDTAYKISKQLNVPYAEKMKEKDFALTAEMKTWGGIQEWKTIGEPEILFAPLEEAKS